MKDVQHSIADMIENSHQCGLKVYEMHAKFLDDAAVSRNGTQRLKSVALWGAAITAVVTIVTLLSVLIKWAAQIQI